MKKLLLIDDDPELSNIYAIFLRARGYEVLIARDGEAALVAIRAALPDLAIVDLLLPKLDGWRFCQRLKQDPKTRHIPVIFLSGLLEEGSGRGEFSLGDAALPKPCPPEKILEKIQELLKEP